MAEKISTLEMKYKNLKTKYNELKKNIIKKILIDVIIKQIYVILIIMKN